MKLKDKVHSDLIEAMKSKDKVKLNTIRSVRALILEFEKSGTGKELTEEEEVKMLSSAVKKRKEAIEQFEKAGRSDLAEKEKQELDILLAYLPKQLSEEEILEKVKEYAAQVGATSKKDFAKLMPVAIKNLKGQAEGGIIRKMVEKVLGE